MDRLCPHCQPPLTTTDSGVFCPHCQHHFVACCPDCHLPLTVLKACGAVDYFCEHGHGLMSKKHLLLLPVDNP
ncbi:zinc ribbon domain-containing protein [Erwinia rhapontici]|uniref:zinc ribbon domain-containing protein n=1 Tax=Erwinia rhapontici TaxID=55212 RepID=UPI001331598A|nr:zinc ribbon domain-containing protein [Erwinia rhapontici]